MENKEINYGTQLLLLIGLAIGCAVVFMIASALIVIPMYGMDSLFSNGITGSLSDSNTVNALKIMQLFNSIGLFIVPPFVFALIIKQKPTQYLKLNNSSKALNYLAVFILMVFAMPVINWMAEVNSQMQLPDFLSGIELWMKQKEAEATALTEAFLQMNNLGDLLYNLLIIAVIPAVGEELLFRGAIQKVLIKWTKNHHAGIWIAAILFSAMHAQFYGFVPRMVLGAMFGYLFVWSGSLWVPVLGHFVNNGAAVLISYFIGMDKISEEIETIGADDNFFIYVLPSIIICSFLLFFFKKQNQTTKLSDDFEGL